MQLVVSTTNAFQKAITAVRVFVPVHQLRETIDYVVHAPISLEKLKLSTQPPRTLSGVMNLTQEEEELLDEEVCQLHAQYTKLPKVKPANRTATIDMSDIELVPSDDEKRGERTSSEEKMSDPVIEIEDLDDPIPPSTPPAPPTINESPLSQRKRPFSLKHTSPAAKQTKPTSPLSPTSSTIVIDDFPVEKKPPPPSLNKKSPVTEAKKEAPKLQKKRKAAEPKTNKVNKANNVAKKAVAPRKKQKFESDSDFEVSASDRDREREESGSGSESEARQSDAGSVSGKERYTDSEDDSMDEDMHPSSPMWLNPVQEDNADDENYEYSVEDEEEPIPVAPSTVPATATPTPTKAPKAPLDLNVPVNAEDIDDGEQIYTKDEAKLYSVYKPVYYGDTYRTHPANVVEATTLASVTLPSCEYKAELPGT